VQTPQGFKDVAIPPVPEKIIYSANYFNIGLDASCSLRFDEGRKEHPKLFKSRVGKTLWYMLYGLKSFGKLRSWTLNQSIQDIIVDGKPMVLPKEAKTLIFINFRSYQNGVDIWWDEELRKEEEEEEESQSEGESDEEESGKGKVRKFARKLQEKVKRNREKDDEESAEESPDELEFQANVWNPEAGTETVLPQSFNDRAIEIAMLEGMMHEASVRSGFDRAKRLGQGQRIVVTTSEGVPVAVDGEAQRLKSPSRIVIELAGQLPILAPPHGETL